ncbi:MAG TPA: diaminopimelate decarboxylase [Bacteroidales bacterium]|nr:diaminopimelate decarboxylase [Bacteroidales bacterium]HPF04373.1 diaminopimelate decarboxylase [Bacteroidales bacterium]HPJ60312.1 diaminopimelate decarboxylase [Bacteroidales bacterium]HPR13585.1 diaminopimelate decarboxylase [Bacteroidales bacterium]HRW86567.1 diaminopimelate decarboxylase [Bacteroidales bacterium]
MITKDKIRKFRDLRTPFYYYDLDVLNNTLSTLREESDKHGYKIHYAVKSNANPRVLQIISSYGFGADCVSWNEIDAALKAGFDPSGIVFAGVGKSDLEISNALKAGIFCFNCESIPEIEVIDQLAQSLDTEARIALRINPLVEAHTHKYITTGIEESKFGIHTWELDNVMKSLSEMKNTQLLGMHFHIGSQITKMSVFQSLCTHVNELNEWFSSRGKELKIINVGGGLGIDYENPDSYPMIKEYINLLHEFIDLKPGQELHMEPGRAVTGQCGSLISKVLYVKNGSNTLFAIIDAGMTDLIRPALYQAHHKIENLTSKGNLYRYDVVGPICESSDTFAKFIELPETQRGDIVAIRSAGAYGEVMASRYNLRDLPAAVFSDEF